MVGMPPKNRRGFLSNRDRATNLFVLPTEGLLITGEKGTELVSWILHQIPATFTKKLSQNLIIPALEKM